MSLFVLVLTLYIINFSKKGTCIWKEREKISCSQTQSQKMFEQ
jgi:hypothetical protein